MMIRTLAQAVDLTRREYITSSSRVHHAHFSFQRAALFPCADARASERIRLCTRFARAPAFAADAPTLKDRHGDEPANRSTQNRGARGERAGARCKVIEFTDWNTPNAALANKDIDVNYFQHIPFLENAKKQGGYNFVAIAPGTIMKIGLYSKKIKRFDELKDGATVAIANDPVNGGRGLLLLQRAGLIKLTPGIDYRATTLDIIDNPKHLKIVQLEASQLARSLDDVDLAQGYPSFIKLRGNDGPE